MVNEVENGFIGMKTKINGMKVNIDGKETGKWISWYENGIF